MDTAVMKCMVPVWYRVIEGEAGAGGRMDERIKKYVVWLARAGRVKRN
jgi:hypothetical protein